MRWCEVSRFGYELILGMKENQLSIILSFFGAVNVGNGIWMLLFVDNWFNAIPGVHDTGPLNRHFVHDVGMVYLLAGVALIWCARHVRSTRYVYLSVMLFFVGHAAIHVIEIIIGLLPPSHWLIDLPLIFVPALILLGLTPSILKLNELSNQTMKHDGK